MSDRKCKGKKSNGLVCGRKPGNSLYPNELQGNYCLWHLSQDDKNESCIPCCKGFSSSKVNKPCSFHWRYPPGFTDKETLKYLFWSGYCRHHIAEALSVPELEATVAAFQSVAFPESDPETTKKLAHLIAGFSGQFNITPILFDLETTGLDFMNDEIVEIAAKNVVTGETFHSLVRPNQPIPEESSNIHGWKTEDVADAPSVAEAFQRFLLFLLPFPNPVLIAHYGKKFDIPIMTFELLRKTSDLGVVLQELRYADSIEVCKGILKLNLPPHKKPYCIQSLSDMFGFSRVQTHQAFDDVDMLETVLDKVAEPAGRLPWEEYIFRFDVNEALRVMAKSKEIPDFTAHREMLIQSMCDQQSG